MAKGWSGTTDEAGSAILGATFWKPGTKLLGVYVRRFETNLSTNEKATCYEFLLAQPSMLEVIVDGKGRLVAEGTEGAKKKKIDRFAMGALTGWLMAIQALEAKGFDGFKSRDRVIIECTGVEPAPPNSGQSDMPKFTLSVERD